MAAAVAAAASLVWIVVADGENGAAPTAFVPGGSTGASFSEAVIQRGQEMVDGEGERRPAAPVRVQTASFADGSVFDLSEERGNVVVMFFMAAWCTTCVPEAAALAQLHEEYGAQGLRILVVDVDTTESESDLARFRQRAGEGKHHWALDADSRITIDYDVRALDTTVVIDRQGRVAFKDFRPTSYEDLVAVISALL